MSHGAYQTFADHYGLDPIQFVMGMTPSSDLLGTKGISQQNAPYEFMNTDYGHLRSEHRATIPGNMYESYGHLDASVHGYIAGKPLGRKSRPANQAYAGRVLFDPVSYTQSDYIPEQTTFGGLPHGYDASQRADTAGPLGLRSHDMKRSSDYFHALQYKLAAPIGSHQHTQS